MIDADAFDVILPTITALGEASTSYAALTLSSRTAGLLCDFLEQQRQSLIYSVDDQYAGARTIGTMTGHMPRFYQSQPGYRDIEIELAHAHVVRHGYAITRWEDRDGRVPVRYEMVQITPFGFVWEATVFDLATPTTDQPTHQLGSPSIVGHVKAGILSLVLLCRIADGTVALHGREPIV